MNSKEEREVGKERRRGKEGGGKQGGREREISEKGSFPAGKDGLL